MLLILSALVRRYDMELVEPKRTVETDRLMILHRRADPAEGPEEGVSGGGDGESSPRPGPRPAAGVRPDSNHFSTLDASLDETGIQGVRIDHWFHNRRLPQRTVPAPISPGTRSSAIVDWRPHACGVGDPVRSVPTPPGVPPATRPSASVGPRWGQRRGQLRRDEARLGARRGPAEPRSLPRGDGKRPARHWVRGPLGRWGGSTRPQALGRSPRPTPAWCIRLPEPDVKGRQEASPHAP